MEAKVKNYLADRKDDVENAIKAYNDALATNDNAKISTAKSNLLSAESEYAKQAASDCYDAILATEQPILTAIKTYKYDVIGHKDIKEDGVTVSVEADYTKTKVIDLYALTQKGKKSKSWACLAQESNLDFLFDTAIDLGFSSAKVKKMAGVAFVDKTTAEAIKKEAASISTSDYMKKRCEDFLASLTDKSAKDPTSKTSLAKGLQATLNELLSLDGVEPNTYKVNSHDVSYIRRVFNRKGKRALTVNTSNQSIYRRILMDVFHRVVCELSYGIEFDIIGKDGKRQAECYYAK